MTRPDRDPPKSTWIRSTILILASATGILYLQDRSPGPAIDSHAPAAEINTASASPALIDHNALPDVTAHTQAAERIAPSPDIGTPTMADMPPADHYQLPELTPANSIAVDIGLPMNPAYPPPEVTTNYGLVISLGSSMDADDLYGMQQYPATEEISIGEDLSADERMSADAPF